LTNKTRNNQKIESGSLDTTLPKSSNPLSSTDVPENNTLGLSDISPSDAPWDKHRASTEVVQSYYSTSSFDRYAQRTDQCSRRLEFALNGSEDGHVGLKLRGAWFCRVRFCPVCQWRRSLRWKANAYQVLPKVIAGYPDCRWLFLSLTVKNVPIVNLKAELAKLNNGFTRLLRLKNWPGLGWLRSTEVTRGSKGDAHHHFHILVLVPKSYFKNNYLSHGEWRDMWKKAMKLDYDPQVDIRAISEKKDPSIVIPELLKYCTKESDLLADREWFIELNKQLHRTRAVATGGVLKKYFAELEKEPEDLIGLDEESEGDDYGTVNFEWKTKSKKYRMID
jgi:plasmid rolling circle replication initiator protein Rep